MVARRVRALVRIQGQLISYGLRSFCGQLVQTASLEERGATVGSASLDCVTGCNAGASVLERVLAGSRLLESVPIGDGAERALHMGVNDLKAVDVGGIDPTESAKKC